MIFTTLSAPNTTTTLTASTPQWRMTYGQTPPDTEGFAGVREPRRPIQPKDDESLAIAIKGETP